MTDSRKPAINYTSREFVTIKNDLVNYAKRYYPNEFRDFSANSFGSLMMDTVAYVGDILSFYIDYQANESFLSTALEYNNVIKLARQMGYSAQLSPSSYGILTFFVLVPAENAAPNYDYAPVLRRGTKVSTPGGKIFSLIEDVNFRDTSNNEIVAGDTDNDTGAPLNYAIRARGQAVSGELAVKTVSVGSYRRFRRVEVPGENITEIVSVSDSAGNPYHKVDYLTQNTVHVSLINRSSDKATVPNILKPITVPRRFTVQKEKNRVYLQFGFGTNTNEEEVLDPSNVLINQHGTKYITDASFDPASLLKTDKLGVAPTDTILTIIYRVNSSANTNAAPNSVTSIVDPILEFDGVDNLVAGTANSVRASLEVTNEKAFVGDAPFPDSDEIKHRAFGNYAMQNRMVTKEDFIAATFSMPPQFGTIKKVNVSQDSESFNQRNINMYVLSADSQGRLAYANNTIKNNLKTYLLGYKMINDTIDILDGKIINLGVSFQVAPFPDVNKYTALQSGKRAIATYLVNRKTFDIGEPFSITDIFAALKNAPNILDVIDVNVFVKHGAAYADTNFDLQNHMDIHARQIICPTDSCFEVKYTDSDIMGTIT